MMGIRRRGISVRLGRTIVASALLCLGLVACRAASPLGSPPASTSPEATADASTSALDADAAQMVALASEELAHQLDVSTEEVTLVRVRPTEWDDASLGCPKPSVDYIRRVTPGYAIWLEAAGDEYEFHTDDASRVIACDTR
jgi:hypothetical protein